MKTATNSKLKADRSPAVEQPALRSVHFELANPTAHKVCLAGNFNDWKPEAGEMARDGDGKWTKDIQLAPGTYEYRLVVDDQWMSDPKSENTVINPFGEPNSVLTIP